MNLFTKKKKGFTIVELVIVVAVIAVLAAILIPTFVGLVDRAHVAADNSLVRELNNALAMDKEINGEHKTMQDALDATEKNGFVVQRIKSKTNTNKILWDSVNDVFCYVTETGVEYIPEAPKKVDLKGSYQLWVISDTVDNTYSTYLYDYHGDTSITTSKGIDLGKEETVEEVNYVHTSGTAQTVIIRTNSVSTNLNVTGYVDSQDNTKGDVINHFGATGELNIVSCATGSYHENGKVAFAEIAKGRIVLESGSDINHIHINKKDSSSFDTVIIKDNGAKELPAKITRDAVTVSEATLVVKVESNGSSENVYVYADGATGTTQKTDEQNIDVNTNLGQLVLDNGTTSKALDADAKTEAKTEVVETALSEEVLEQGTKDNKVYVARIGSKAYETFKEAVDEAQGNDVIYVIGDFNVFNNIGNYNEGGLSNKVILSDNVIVTFTNNSRIYFAEGGKIELNGKSLTIKTDGTGIQYYQAGLFQVKKASAGDYVSMGGLETALDLSHDGEVRVLADLIYSDKMLFVTYNNNSSSEYCWSIGGTLTGSIAGLAGQPINENEIFMAEGESVNLYDKYNSTLYDYDEFEALSYDDEIISAECDFGAYIRGLKPGKTDLTILCDGEDEFTFTVTVISNKVKIVGVEEPFAGFEAASQYIVENNLDNAIIKLDNDVMATSGITTGYSQVIGGSKDSGAYYISRLTGCRNVTLDLNGHTIFGSYFNIINTNLTVIDSSESKTGRIDAKVDCDCYDNLYWQSNSNIDNTVELTSENINDYISQVNQEYRNSLFDENHDLIVNTTTVTFQGGTIKSINLNYTVKVVIDGANVINSAEPEGYTEDGCAITLSRICSNSELIVKSGIISGTVAGICSEGNNCLVTINGGSVQQTLSMDDYFNRPNCAIILKSTTTLNINGGDIYAEALAINLDGSDVVVNVNGGTIYSKFFTFYYRSVNSDERVINISDGKVIGEEGFISANLETELSSSNYSGTMTITGGHFAQNLEDMNWLSENYECLNNGDGTWKVVAKA